MIRRLVIIAVAVAVVIVALAVTQPWLYFVNREVNEAFPGLNDAQRQAVADMPEQEKQALIDMANSTRKMVEDTAIAQSGADTVVPIAEQAMPPDMPAEPTVLLMGSFIDIDPIHGAEGSATIYEVPDGNRVLRFEDFRSKNGPDLHVYLSTEAPTSTFAGLGANEIHLGALKGNVGNQNYDVPAEVDLSQYRSVVIYCVPFRVVFSTAAFS
ncbi:MAG: DM13 domain-containing protein [Chloroflexota bacterium]|nr:DM13 domain-containing protein [Chloroflexota bacterium]